MAELVPQFQIKGQMQGLTEHSLRGLGGLFDGGQQLGLPDVMISVLAEGVGKSSLGQIVLEVLKFLRERIVLFYMDRDGIILLFCIDVELGFGRGIKRPRPMDFSMPKN
jgi:hypothetical protein